MSLHNMAQLHLVLIISFLTIHMSVVHLSKVTLLISHFSYVTLIGDIFTMKNVTSLSIRNELNLCQMGL